MIPALHCHIDPAGEDAGNCDATGWKVRTGCADPHGRVHCPLCRRRVPARAAGDRVVELDPHQADRP